VAVFQGELESADFLSATLYPPSPEENFYELVNLALFTYIYRVSRYQKGKTSLDFTEARDSEWQ